MAIEYANAILKWKKYGAQFYLYIFEDWKRRVKKITHTSAKLKSMLFVNDTMAIVRLRTRQIVILQNTHSIFERIAPVLSIVVRVVLNEFVS